VSYAETQQLAAVAPPHRTYQPQHTSLGWLAVGLIFASSRILDRGVAMRTELDTVI
jgi:hypothetical protein